MVIAIFCWYHVFIYLAQDKTDIYIYKNNTYMDCAGEARNPQGLIITPLLLIFQFIYTKLL